MRLAMCRAYGRFAAAGRFLGFARNDKKASVRRWVGYMSQADFSSTGGRVKGIMLALAQACLSGAVEHAHTNVGMASELGYANYSFSWRIL